MTKFILDSDTSIFCLRGRHGIAERIRDIGVWNCCISQVTVAELRYGAECSDYFIRRHREIDELCESMSIVPISNAIIHVYAVQKARMRKLGLLIPDFDLLIGATAVYHGLVLVTNNTKHFERMQSLQLENWMQLEMEDEQ
jgi:tRNA(fMet)-specific endonuclease VapC